MQEITNNEFAEKVTNQQYAVVDYWAPWCSACVAMMPKVEQVSSESNIPFYKANIDEQPELKTKAGIRAIPALIFYRNGKMVDFLFGDNSSDKIKEKLENLIG